LSSAKEKGWRKERWEDFAEKSHLEEEKPGGGDRKNRTEREGLEKRVMLKEVGNEKSCLVKAAGGRGI